MRLLGLQMGVTMGHLPGLSGPLRVDSALPFHAVGDAPLVNVAFQENRPTPASCEQSPCPKPWSCEVRLRGVLATIPWVPSREDDILTIMNLIP